MNRVFKVNVGDLEKSDESEHNNSNKIAHFRSFHQDGSNNLLCLFDGLSTTRDAINSKLRKFHKLIQAHCDVKTTDG